MWYERVVWFGLASAPRNTSVDRVKPRKVFPHALAEVTQDAPKLHSSIDRNIARGPEYLFKY